MMQMGSVGPMLGQAHHFLKFNTGKSDYAEKRYGDEAKRIYGVLDQAARRGRVPRRRLFDRRHRDLAVDLALRVAGHRLRAVSRISSAGISRSRRGPPCSAATTCRSEVSADPAAGVAARSAVRAVQCMCCVPQHPPMMRAPPASQSRVRRETPRAQRSPLPPRRRRSR